MTLFALFRKPVVAQENIENAAALPPAVVQQEQLTWKGRFIRLLETNFFTSLVRKIISLFRSWMNGEAPPKELPLIIEENVNKNETPVDQPPTKDATPEKPADAKADEKTQLIGQNILTPSPQKQNPPTTPPSPVKEDPQPATQTDPSPLPLKPIKEQAPAALTPSPQQEKKDPTPVKPALPPQQAMQTPEPLPTQAAFSPQTPEKEQSPAAPLIANPPIKQEEKEEIEADPKTPPTAPQPATPSPIETKQLQVPFSPSKEEPLPHTEQASEPLPDPLPPFIQVDHALPPAPTDKHKEKPRVQFSETITVQTFSPDGEPPQPPTVGILKKEPSKPKSRREAALTKNVGEELIKQALLNNAEAQAQKQEETPSTNHPKPVLDSTTKHLSRRERAKKTNVGEDLRKQAAEAERKRKEEAEAEQKRKAEANCVIA